MTEPESQDSIVDNIYKKYDRCDYLFNCAGTLETGSIQDIDIDKMSLMIRLNVETTFRLTHRILKEFKNKDTDM